MAKVAPFNDAASLSASHSARGNNSSAAPGLPLDKFKQQTALVAKATALAAAAKAESDAQPLIPVWVTDKMLTFIDGMPMSSLLMLCTFWALLASDIFSMAIDKSLDIVLTVGLTVSFFAFLLDIIIQTMARY